MLSLQRKKAQATLFLQLFWVTVPLFILLGPIIMHFKSPEAIEKCAKKHRTFGKHLKEKWWLFMLYFLVIGIVLFFMGKKGWPVIPISCAIWICYDLYPEFLIPLIAWKKWKRRIIERR